MKLGQLEKEEKRLLSLIKVAKPHLLPALPPMPVMEYKEEIPMEEEPKSSALPDERTEPEVGKAVESPPESKKPRTETESTKPPLAASKAGVVEVERKPAASKTISSLKPTIETKVTKPAQPADQSPQKEASKTKSTKESVYVLEGREEKDEKGGLVVRKKKAKGMEKPKVSLLLNSYFVHSTNCASDFRKLKPRNGRNMNQRTRRNTTCGFRLVINRVTGRRR